MKITHVIRGDDHLSNTPRQVLIYEALGWDVPAFAHVPMIHGPDGSKLSKRHGAASVEELEAAGYIPSAVRNAVALLGWNRDEDSTIHDHRRDDRGLRYCSRSQVACEDRLSQACPHQWAASANADADEFAQAYDRWRTRWVGDGHELYDAAWGLPLDVAPLLVQEKVAMLSEIPPLVRFLACGRIPC